MDVVRLNCSVSEPGLYEWMLMRWSSEPEARRRPDRDQLPKVSQHCMRLYQRVCVPQSVYTSIVPLQLIHNVQIVDPMLVAVDASNIRVCPTLMADFPPQEAIVHGVLHAESQCSSARACGGLLESSAQVVARQFTRASRVIARRVTSAVEG